MTRDQNRAYYSGSLIGIGVGLILAPWLNDLGVPKAAAALGGSLLMAIGLTIIYFSRNRK